MKLLTERSDEHEVREFLDAHIHLNDASAQLFAKHSDYLRKAGRGKPRNLAYVEIFQLVANRTENLTISEAIDDALPLVELPPEKNESVKRGYHRHQERTHPLLDPSVSYNDEHFAKAVLAKHFDIAAAISQVCSDSVGARLSLCLMKSP